MVDFTIPECLRGRAETVRAWVVNSVVPYEADPRLTHHGPTDELRQELIEQARAKGFLTVQAAPEYGGWGLSHLEQAAIFEAAGWSHLGPIAMNCAAPDEGNMVLLSKVASREQRDRHLRPLIDGRQRSAFAVTEPGGAGSDPTQLRTTAVFDGDAFRIRGRKWLITGADGANTWIIMADLRPNAKYATGPTLFLCDGETAGIVIERAMNTMDRNYVGGHAVVRFDDLVLAESALLGEPGEALRYAQMRLAPARLTHAMRWLGAASRAQEIAIEHAKTRTAFGNPIAEYQGVSFQLADNEIALHHCRLSIQYACWLLDHDQHARHESSLSKVFVSEELFKVVDRCVQVLGGIGVTEETAVSRIFSDLRGFRLYDGPTEVHKYAIARRLLR